MPQQRVSYEIKLKILIRYLENHTVESIQGDTTFELEDYKEFGLKDKKIKIGLWVQNLRADYLSGRLKMDKDLLESFRELGLLEKKKEKTTIQDKYEFLMSLANKSEEERAASKMESGMSYDEVIKFMQRKYEKGLLQRELTVKQIENLLSNDLLKLSDIENSKEFRKYFSTLVANKLQAEYGSFNNFLLKIKTGEAEVPPNYFCGARIVTLSEKEMTVERKKQYVDAITDVLSLEGEVFEDCYIDIDGFEQALSQLSQLDKESFNLIKLRLGLQDDRDSNNNRKYSKRECIKELGRSQKKIDKIEKQARDFLREKANLYWKNIRDFKDEQDKYQKESETLEQSISNLTKIIQYIADENGGLKEFSDIELRELGLPSEYFNNCVTINDLIDLEFKRWKEEVAEKRIYQLTSDNRITKIFQDLKIRTVSDLFKYSREEFKKYDGLNDWIDAILDEIEKNAINQEGLSRNEVIEKLNLSTAAFNRLKRHEINTIGDLINMSGDDLLKIRGLGKNLLEEITSQLENAGYKLRNDQSQESENSFETIANELFRDVPQEKLKVLIFLKKYTNMLNDYRDRDSCVKIKVSEIQEEISRYDLAYNNFITENVFDPDGIVPAVSDGDKQKRLELETIGNSNSLRSIAEAERSMKRYGNDNTL